MDGLVHHTRMLERQLTSQRQRADALEDAARFATAQAGMVALSLGSALDDIERAVAAFVADHAALAGASALFEGVSRRVTDARAELAALQEAAAARQAATVEAPPIVPPAADLPPPPPPPSTRSHKGSRRHSPRRGTSPASSPPPEPIAAPAAAATEVDAETERLLHAGLATADVAQLRRLLVETRRSMIHMAQSFDREKETWAATHEGAIAALAMALHRDARSAMATPASTPAPSRPASRSVSASRRAGGRYDRSAVGPGGELDVTLASVGNVAQRVQRLQLERNQARADCAALLAAVEQFVQLAQGPTSIVPAAAREALASYLADIQRALPTAAAGRQGHSPGGDTVALAVVASEGPPAGLDGSGGGESDDGEDVVDAVAVLQEVVERQAAEVDSEVAALAGTALRDGDGDGDFDGGQGDEAIPTLTVAELGRDDDVGQSGPTAVSAVDELVGAAASRRGRDTMHASPAPSPPASAAASIRSIAKTLAAVTSDLTSTGLRASTGASALASTQAGAAAVPSASGAPDRLQRVPGGVAAAAGRGNLPRGPPRGGIPAARPPPAIAVTAPPLAAAPAPPASSQPATPTTAASSSLLASTVLRLQMSALTSTFESLTHRLHRRNSEDEALMAHRIASLRASTSQRGTPATSPQHAHIAAAAPAPVPSFVDARRDSGVWRAQEYRSISDGVASVGDAVAALQARSAHQRAPSIDAGTSAGVAAAAPPSAATTTLQRQLEVLQSANARLLAEVHRLHGHDDATATAAAVATAAGDRRESGSSSSSPSASASSELAATRAESTRLAALATELATALQEAMQRQAALEEDAAALRATVTTERGLAAALQAEKGDMAEALATAAAVTTQQGAQLTESMALAATMSGKVTELSQRVARQAADIVRLQGELQAALRRASAVETAAAAAGGTSATAAADATARSSWATPRAAGAPAASVGDSLAHGTQREEEALLTARREMALLAERVGQMRSIVALPMPASAAAGGVAARAPLSDAESVEAGAVDGVTPRQVEALLAAAQQRIAQLVEDRDAAEARCAEQEAAIAAARHRLAVARSGSLAEGSWPPSSASVDAAVATALERQAATFAAERGDLQARSADAEARAAEAALTLDAVRAEAAAATASQRNAERQLSECRRSLEAMATERDALRLQVSGLEREVQAQRDVMRALGSHDDSRRALITTSERLVLVEHALLAASREMARMRGVAAATPAAATAAIGSVGGSESPRGGGSAPAELLEAALAQEAALLQQVADLRQAEAAARAEVRDARIQAADMAREIAGAFNASLALQPPLDGAALLAPAGRADLAARLARLADTLREVATPQSSGAAESPAADGRIAHLTAQVRLLALQKSALAKELAQVYEAVAALEGNVKQLQDDNRRLATTAALASAASRVGAIGGVAAALHPTMPPAGYAAVPGWSAPPTPTVAGAEEAKLDASRSRASVGGGGNRSEAAAAGSARDSAMASFEASFARAIGGAPPHSRSVYAPTPAPASTLPASSARSLLPDRSTRMLPSSPAMPAVPALASGGARFDVDSGEGFDVVSRGSSGVMGLHVPSLAGGGAARSGGGSMSAAGWPRR